MRLLEGNNNDASDPLILTYGRPFTMKSVHGRMLTFNTHEYSAKTFLNAFVQISASESSSSVKPSGGALMGATSHIDASTVKDYVKTVYENASSPSHYGVFVMQPANSKISKTSPVCYGQIVHIYFVRDQDQKKESCGKYLIINGNFPQLGFVGDGDHQNLEPIAVSAIKTLPNEELQNFPVRIGEDIGLKRVVCNQLDQFYLSCRKANNICQRNKSTNLAAWEKFTLCFENGKSVQPSDRDRLLNSLYSETTYLRDITIIISFRNQFKKAVPKENIPTEDELKNIIENEIGFPTEEVSYIDSMNDWMVEDQMDDEEIEEPSTSSLGEAQKEYETPKVLQNDNKEKKIFTKYAKVVFKKKSHRDLLGDIFLYEITKSLLIKCMIPKDFAKNLKK
ncbi:hypothetical protein FDP41_010279 [Naegleria fowleri]|uniref:Uncharacterized protein n=1 Tax=Naegleria fowleri TaxID=5763 RepID=A0A6A5C9K2_NAEFO|nr:uncharacterized protein FDP41_010279 [Naegleria fowleri]KAF0983214.1 hypothetical protein FDP41_010279 [Naegleria fowleri]